MPGLHCHGYFCRGLLVGEVAEYVEGGFYFIFCSDAVNQYFADTAQLGKIDVAAHVFLVVVHKLD